MRAIVLTSTMRRHTYVANALAARLPVVGVWQEEKSFEPLKYAGNADEQAVIQKHFDARDASEHEWFRDHDKVQVPARWLRPGECNDSLEIASMRRAQPDVVLVFGTGLLKQPLIDAFAGNILNIHLGLSPYYRGAGTNFWPLVNGEPEFCGATIHFLDAGVDSGPIIAHVRPEMAASDGPHDIGNKTIMAAADMLATAAIAHVKAPLRGVPQSGNGRLYKRANFSASAVDTLCQNFANGMIAEYLQNRAARDAKIDLVRMEVEAR